MDDQLLDKKRIEKLLANGDPSFLKEMIELFEERSLTLVTELQILYAAGNIRDASRAFHALKGISLTVGAVAIARACTQAEQEMKNPQNPNLEAIVNSIADLRKICIAEMNKYLR